MSGGRPCCCCRYCKDHETPREFQVRLTGFRALDPAECANCPSLDGTYVLDRLHGNPGPHCTWQYPLPDAVCGVSWIGLCVVESFGDYYLYVWLSDQNLNCGAQGMFPVADALCYFRKDYGATKPDCAHLAAVAIGYAGASALFTCDGAAASCEVTAL